MNVHVCFDMQMDGWMDVCMLAYRHACMLLLDGWMDG